MHTFSLKEWESQTPFKTKYYKRIEKRNCKNKPPKTLYLTINGTRYFDAIQKEKLFEDIAFTFHGYKPRNYDDSKKRFIRRIVHSTANQQQHAMEILLESK